MLIVLVALPLRSDTTSLRLNLKQALSIALEQSLAVDKSRIQKVKGSEAIVEGAAGFLPRLSVSSSTGATSLDSLGESAWASQFSLSQPVVDATTILGLVNGIQENGLARSQSRQTTARLILDVENAYYNLAKAQALLESSQGQYTRALESQRTAEKRYSLGAASKSDKLRADASLLSAERELISAQVNLEQNQRILADRIGVDTRQPLEVEELPPPLEPDSSYSVVVSSALLKRNPDFDVLRRQVTASDLALIGAWASLLPSLSFTANKTLSQDGFIPDLSGWEDAPNNYGLAVSFPVADIKSRALGIAKSHINRKEARINLAEQELQFRERFAALLDAQETSFKGYEVASKNVELSREVYRLSARSYELGASTLAELLQVEAELIQAERALVEAKALYWSSLAELNYFLGIDGFLEFSLEDR